MLFYLTGSFKAFPGRNSGTFFALMVISCPVCGFLPSLAFLFCTLKIPKPISVTVSFFFNALVTVEKIQSTAGFLESAFRPIVNRSRVYPPCFWRVYPPLAGLSAVILVRHFCGGLEGSPAVFVEGLPADHLMATSFTGRRIRSSRPKFISCFRTYVPVHSVAS